MITSLDLVWFGTVRDTINNTKQFFGRAHVPEHATHCSRQGVGIISRKLVRRGLTLSESVSGSTRSIEISKAQR